ncbi:bifunctional glutamine-synthetase adenylyltransferase/deadenyltransferase, partial [Frankia sp. AiPs1]|nr:bifunctional glutamine-synthetase adenylyltransferase/deadenyltransferase [Frankia sp. AiPs1]
MRVEEPGISTGFGAPPAVDHPRGSSVAAQLARLGFSDVDRVAAIMARLGLLGGQPRLAANIAAAADGATGADVAAGADWASGANDVARANVVVGALAGAADPDLALAALDRLVDALGPADGSALVADLAEHAGLRNRLCAVLGASRALGDHLARYPADWRVLLPDELVDAPPDAGRMRAALLRAVGADPAGEAP